jgi:hypothetical protein
MFAPVEGFGPRVAINISMLRRGGVANLLNPITESLLCEALGDGGTIFCIWGGGVVGEAGLQRGNVGLMQFDMPCSKAFVFSLPGSRQIAEYSFIYLFRFYCSARADCVVCPYCSRFFVLYCLLSMDFMATGWI